MEKLQNQFSLFQVSEVEVSYRPKFKLSDRPVITSSKDIYEILYNNWDMNKIEFVEQFKILLISRGNKVLGIYEVSTGGRAGTLADPKVIFAAALKGAAVYIVLAHNHPSGNLKPSQADINLTRKIINGGELLDIPVLDHLILTTNGYFHLQMKGCYSPFLYPVP